MSTTLMHLENNYEIYTVLFNSTLFGEISFQQIEIASGYPVNSARAWDYNKDGHKDVLYTGDG